MLAPKHGITAFQYCYTGLGTLFLLDNAGRSIQNPDRMCPERCSAQVSRAFDSACGQVLIVRSGFPSVTRGEHYEDV
jgi:hypothetical protein